jgi:hypothetical protein
MDRHKIQLDRHKKKKQEYKSGSYKRKIAKEKTRGTKKLLLNHVV